MKLSTALPACITALAALLASAPSHALFKVVGPDGKVTYTDRPPPPEAGSAKPLNARNTAAPEVALPFELRQVVARYPVTLYTTVNCAPCESGRRWLRERGVPYAEKTVSTNEEGQALARTVGGNDLPALTIGSQPVRGYSPDQWGQLFDVAGYPKTSQLPNSYKYAPAVPMIPVSAPAAPASAAASAPAAPLPTPPAITPDNPNGIKF